MHEDINALQYESALLSDNSSIEARLTAKRTELAKLNDEIHIFQKEFNQLSRQFWISKESIVDRNYDLSANRYRQLERDEVYYPRAAKTLTRMQQLHDVLDTELKELEQLFV